MDLNDFERDWTYLPSTPPVKLKLKRAFAKTFHKSSAPHFTIAGRIGEDVRWNIYFVYLPDGRLQENHYFTLAALRREPGKLLVVCAASQLDAVPAAIFEAADCVIWKGLSGFDFSAYSIAMHVIAEHSNVVDIFLMNDSVHGPAGPLKDHLSRMRWDINGFTACGMHENHLQSYALYFRQFDKFKLNSLLSIFPRNYAYDHFTEVILMQETLLSRAAYPAMTSGALWYSRDIDPSLGGALDLFDKGFPFLKRSLLGKSEGLFRREQIEDRLEKLYSRVL